MLPLAQKRQANPRQAITTTNANATEQQAIQARKQELIEKEQALRKERRALRKQRQLEDQAWHQVKARHQSQQRAYRTLSRRQRRAQRIQKKTQDQIWHEQRTTRRSQKSTRKQENQTWREQRNQLRQDLANLPMVFAFVAILVVIDNCTRQCLGIPMFVAGANVTAEMVLDSLKYFCLVNSNI